MHGERKRVLLLEKEPTTVPEILCAEIGIDGENSRILQSDLRHKIRVSRAGQTEIRIK